MSLAPSLSLEKPASQSLRGYALALGLGGVLCVALRLANLDASLAIDEAGSIAQASAADYWAAARQDVHPPLYYLVLRAGLAWTDSVPVLRLFSVACGTGLAALAAWSMRPSLPAAVAAGAMGALLPQLVYHSQQLRPYALLFLFLGLALALAARPIAKGTAEASAPVRLAAVLLIAAATHLVTGFFLLALVPLLVWPVRRRSAAAWLAALWPMLPAGLLLLWFKFYFVSQPKDLAQGWWVPATNVPAILAALAEATGWDNVRWLADAAARRWAAAGWGVPLVALTALAAAFSTVWNRREAGPLNVLLPVSALVFAAALVGYSLCFEPIVLGRTLLPALIPLGAGLAWGIAHHPVPWRRWLAAAAVVVYLVLAILPAVRLSLVPVAGLRGLAGNLRDAHRPGDQVILFRALDYGLAPYWPGLASLPPTHFDTAQAVPPQLLALRASLAGLAPDGRIWLAYRDDYYFRHNPAAYEAVRAEIAASHRDIRIFWQEKDLTLLLAEPPAR